MSVQSADPIAAYLEANARFDAEAMLAPFAEDATVIDEKRTHEGRDALRAWIEEATIGNRAVATPLSVAPDGADRVMVAEVAGAFPGSPVTLTFRFTLAGGRIARLEIGP